MSRAKVIANIAISAALLSAVKFALSAIPNVELVTLLILVFASRLRLPEVIAITSTFCCIEMMIFGVNTWVISYLIHWNCLGVVAWLFSRIPIKNIYAKSGVMTAAALVMTTLFGVVSTLVDTGLFTGFFEDFWTRFAIMYVGGGYFFLAHIVSNAIIIPLLYAPVTKVYSQAISRYLSNNTL